ncbi:MAG: ECF transporter S component [Infirmifilum sp.]
MKTTRSRLLATASIMAALTTVATIIVQVPVPETHGYINLGDTMVMLSGVLFGPLTGALAGGIGSALADILSGYPGWAPFTLVIKGLEGLVVGLLASRGGRAMALLGCALGGAVMVLGYFTVEYFLYGAGAFAELPGNIVQALAGLVVAYGVGVEARRVLKRV